MKICCMCPMITNVYDGMHCSLDPGHFFNDKALLSDTNLLQGEIGMTFGQKRC